nr:PfkB family carbohydrate kinase [Phreatobacter stygius]
MQSSADRIRLNVPNGSRVAFVSGNFNILHPGHLRLLRFASDLADVLVVGLNPDGTSGVTVPGEMRIESILALSFVQNAVLLSESPTQFISRLKPDFVVKGKEFEQLNNPEAKAVVGYGGKLIFSSGEMRFASMELLQKEYTDTVFSTIHKPPNFHARHRFEMADLHRLLGDFEKVRVTVIGDIIIDDYITCEPLGMSQEDPTIVVTPLETKTFVGGAGVVAAHARNLGAQTRFFSVFGADDAADYACAALKDMNVEVHAFRDETRPTTRKQRYRAHNKTLLRVNHLRQHAVSAEISDTMLDQLTAVLNDTDLIMFSDFNYGCLPQRFVDQVTKLARERGIPMTADSQASSQMSDISRFRGMALVTPTEREARLALHDSNSGLAFLAQDLHEKAMAESVIITLGGEGMLILGRGEDGQPLTDRLPAMNKAPKDVAGAGDSLFTAASIALCTGADIWRSAYLGGIAAACQISRVGNSPLKASDILIELDQPDIE